MFLALIQIRHSRGGTRKQTQTVIDSIQKEIAIDHQQCSCETLICQRNQTILRLLSSAATASTWSRVRKLYCHFTCMRVCVCVCVYIYLPYQSQACFVWLPWSWILQPSTLKPTAVNWCL